MTTTGDLLKRENSALPEVRSWLAATISTYDEDARPVSALGYTRLTDYFPSDVLDRARLVIVNRIPFPPLSAFGFPELSALESMPFGGITFDHVVFAHKSAATESALFHELVHVVQWSALGVDDFLLTCGLCLAQYGYAKSPFEAMAFDMQSQFDRRVAVTDLVGTVQAHARQTRSWAAEVFRQNNVPMGQ
jgi:hypothetical protein